MSRIMCATFTSPQVHCTALHFFPLCSEVHCNTVYFSELVWNWGRSNTCFILHLNSRSHTAVHRVRVKVEVDMITFQHDDTMKTDHIIGHQLLSSNSAFFLIGRPVCWLTPLLGDILPSFLLILLLQETSYICLLLLPLQEIFRAVLFSCHLVTTSTWLSWKKRNLRTTL